MNLDPTRAMSIHDIDVEGAMELARQIIDRHGGGEAGVDALSEMVRELAEAGFLPISGHWLQ